MPNNLEGFFLPGHNRARFNRWRHYATIGRTFVAAVAVEAGDGSWFEMDAESRDHAVRLADNAVRLHDARGASCRYVEPDTGKVCRAAFYTVFPEYDFDSDGIDGAI